VAALQLVLEDQGRLAVGHPVRQRGDRELGQVQLVLPPRVLRRPALLGRFDPPHLLDRGLPLVHPLPRIRHHRRRSRRSFLVPNLKEAPTPQPEAVVVFLSQQESKTKSLRRKWLVINNLKTLSMSG